MTYRHGTILAGLCLAATLAGGCNPPADDIYKKLIDAEAKASALVAENADLRQTLADRQEQIARLQNFGDKRLDLLFHVDRIELGSHTGGVDLNGDGADEGIRVFLTPIDQHGTTLKAAGEIDVELYDLAAPPTANLLKKCHWTVEQAAKDWASGLFGHHYSLTCPWDGRIPQHDGITVRVTFADYLTGKAFTAQAVCKVKLPAASQPASQRAD